ncbi:MAG TPA: esterase-like activity of phytase family protein [Chloroflexota bacterium]|nr:esterase-like activity of phytase family protein [Chloroflexota bacterium]
MQTAIFPDMRISTVLNAAFPGLIENDHKLMVGGVGSDIWHSPEEPSDELWMITDRGPNGRARVDGKERRIFPIPSYTPLIIHARTDGSTVSVLQVIPITGQSGRPVTGLPNLEKHNETIYDYSAERALPFNPSGLDTEGLVRGPSGEFWLADEYAPSLLRVGADGKVNKRFIPEGLKLSGADYPTVDALPGIFGQRADNRGFESIALSGDGRTLFLATQSALSNTGKEDDALRNTRILAFDIASERPTAEYVYRLDPVAEFDSSVKNQPEEMRISALVWAGSDSLLVLERTDRVAKLFRVNLGTATNVLGSAWDDSDKRPSLEMIRDPGSVGIQVLSKSLVVDFSTLGKVPDKLEGVAILDPSTLLVANDNDFDVGKFDKNGNNVGEGLRSQILKISLATPLP